MIANTKVLSMKRYLPWLSLMVFLCLEISTATAESELDCSVSAADNFPRALPEIIPERNSYRIYWHIATQIEDLADAGNSAARTADIKAAQKLVDGYYINFLIRGMMTYWPERPAECALNKKKRTRESIARCAKLQDELVSELGYPDESSLQVDSMKRVVRNLGLAGEQAAGKEIIGEMILGNQDMTYDAASDRIVLRAIPKTPCFLGNDRLSASAFMVYQEPNVQIPGGTFLHVPTRKGQPAGDSGNPKDDKLPENARMIPMLKKAFEAAGVPMGKLYANIRRWNARKTPVLGRQLASMPEVAGFNFEIGSGILAEQPHRFRPLTRGIAWVLQNTKENVSVLMPGYWSGNDPKSIAEIDTLPSRLRDFVIRLNDSITSEMGLPKGQNAICDSRLILIPASYGRPVHVRTLPSKRNGKYAGTVTGQIHLLNDLRKELCGG